MGLLEDVRKILADIPLWKELGTLPDRTKLLEQRVAELEAKLNGKYPADVCPRCGERTMRATASYGPNNKGMMMQDWQCKDKECNYQETRTIKPK
jgi:hypothetical protein